MELGLSLGDSSRPFGFLPKNRETVGKGLCMALGINLSNGREREKPELEKQNPSHGRSADEDNDDEDDDDGDDHNPLQLDLLPLAPLPRRTTSHGSSEGGSSAARGFDVNRLPPPATAAEDVEEGAAAVSSSPNSVASSFQMDFCIFRGAAAGNKRDLEAAGIDGAEAAERASSRASDDDDNGLARKKLRLSKEQSAYLEESFKEHNTLNPKQKLALAKQLNLRPRQVEVWFQNRRARTKLKQTEVDCEYLKRCCETLSEENRKLHKELQELRALKNTSNPFYMQLPATTLTMCPSCERVASTTTAATATTTNSTDRSSTTTTTTPFPLSRPRLFPFPHTQPHQSAAS